MQAESLDVLEKAEVPPAQARAIVRAIEIELAGARDTLATKHDLLLLRQDLRAELAELGQDLRGELAELRQDLRGEVAELGQGLRREVAELGQGLRREVAELGQQTVGLRGELRAEIHATASSTTRQMYMALLGQMAVLLGVAYFFVTHIA